MLVLDAGAGTSPYRQLFAHARYEACDFAQLGTRYAPLDYVCDLTDIPVEEGRFDRVIFNQVLEHLPDPPAALRELHRVLKPGGRLFCSAPLFYAEHQKPYDFYRYTKFGLRRLFEDAGFTVVRIEWLEGYFGTIAYQLAQMNRQLPRSRQEVRALGTGRRTLPVWALVSVTRRLARRAAPVFARLDVDYRYTKRGMPKNYVIVVRKPDPSAAS